MSKRLDAAEVKLVTWADERDALAKRRAELGFLAGLAAGVTVGLLFAPKSGKQTKHFIAQKAHSRIGQVSAAGKKLAGRLPPHTGGWRQPLWAGHALLGESQCCRATDRIGTGKRARLLETGKRSVS